MKLKTTVGMFISACAIIGIVLFGLMKKEPYSTVAVMDSLWDKYDVQSTLIGDTEPVLDVSVYDEKDIIKVESYLKNNLSKEDLAHFKLVVYQYSENIWEFRENAQEKRKSVYK